MRPWTKPSGRSSSNTSASATGRSRAAVGGGLSVVVKDARLHDALQSMYIPPSLLRIGSTIGRGLGISASLVIVIIIIIIVIIFFFFFSFFILLHSFSFFFFFLPSKIQINTRKKDSFSHKSTKSNDIHDKLHHQYTSTL